MLLGLLGILCVMMVGAIGYVKWFSNTKGYGFIIPEDEQSAEGTTPLIAPRELFVHFKDIEGQDGYRELGPGDKVEYEEVNDGRGPKAKKVTRKSTRDPRKRTG